MDERLSICAENDLIMQAFKVYEPLSVIQYVDLGKRNACTERQHEEMVTHAKAGKREYR